MEDTGFLTSESIRDGEETTDDEHQFRKLVRFVRKEGEDFRIDNLVKFLAAIQGVKEVGPGSRYARVEPSESLHEVQEVSNSIEEYYSQGGEKTSEKLSFDSSGFLHIPESRVDHLR